MEFIIKYWDSDHGGMRTELTRTEFYNGTHELAVKHAENQKSPWGFNYTFGENEGHGKATIIEKPHGVVDRMKQIEILEEQIRLLEME